MFDVISSAKSTRWLSFPTLDIHSTHPHAFKQDVDFQLTPEQNMFVQFNKSYGVEILQTGIANGKRIVASIKKFEVEDLSSGAVSKVTGNSLAIGMRNGVIRFFDRAANEFTPVKFKPDKISKYLLHLYSMQTRWYLNCSLIKRGYFLTSDQSVSALEFSCCDGYLAAVYDNSDINLYGLRTGIKTDTFRLDES